MRLVYIEQVYRLSLGVDCVSWRCGEHWGICGGHVDNDLKIEDIGSGHYFYLRLNVRTVLGEFSQVYSKGARNTIMRTVVL